MDIVQLELLPPDLPLDRVADFYPNFLNPTQADELFTASLALDWQQNQITMFGKAINNPRLESIYGDPGCDYVYSGILLEARPWAEPLLKLRDRLEAEFGYRFHIAIGNLYRDGNDSIGWHADTEETLAERPPIASISLGVTRRFSLRPNDKSTFPTHFDLTHGSLLLMLPGCQQTHKHQLPKRPNLTERRINWTFRPHIRGH